MESTDAIVLNLAPYSETTYLVSLLTREHGVVRVLAKGVRRGKGAVQAAFEPFAWIHTQIRLKDPGSLGTMFGATPQNGWPYLRSDIERLAYAGLGLEVLGGLAAHSPAEPLYFDEAVDFLEKMGVVEGPGTLAATLLLRLLHQAGFPPQLAEPWTAETLPASLTWHFDRNSFARPDPGDGMHTMRLPKAALAVILPALQSPPPLEPGWRLTARTGPPVLRWLTRVWADHLNEPLKSVKFLEKMVLK